MSETINIARWIDLDDQQFKTVEYYNYIRKVVLSGLDYGIIFSDNMGHLYMNDEKGTKIPIHADFEDQVVGIRYSMKAHN